MLDEVEVFNLALTRLAYNPTALRVSALIGFIGILLVAGVYRRDGAPLRFRLGFAFNQNSATAIFGASAALMIFAGELIPIRDSLASGLPVSLANHTVMIILGWSMGLVPVAICRMQPIGKGMMLRNHTEGVVSLHFWGWVRNMDQVLAAPTIVAKLIGRRASIYQKAGTRELRIFSPFFMLGGLQGNIHSSRIRKWEVELLAAIPGATIEPLPEGKVGIMNSLILRLLYRPMREKFPFRSFSRVPAAGFTVRLPSKASGS